MIQIPIEVIYILIAIILSGIFIAGIIYHYRKLVKVKEETEREVKERISKVEIEGNKLRVDGRELSLRKYQQQLEYDMMKVEIKGKEDLFMVWRDEKIEELKRKIVKDLPFQVFDKRIKGTNIRQLIITTYMGIDK